MKLGIGSYAFMWSIGFPGADPPEPMEHFGLIAKARELGVKLVQYGPNLPLEALSDAQLDRLAAAARDAGVEIEVGKRGIETEVLRRNVAIARLVGASYIRSVPEFQDGVTPPLDELERLLRCIEPELAAARVRVGFENARIPAARLAAVLDSVASPWIGITLDTVNSFAVSEGTEFVASNLARHTMCLHVKEFSVRRVWHMMGFTIEGLPAGKGQLNVPWLLELLAAEGRNPNAILEQWVPQQSTVAETAAMEQAWSVESIAYLRQLIAD
jgi:3-oxoisoapionate decarboxylase